MVFPWFPGSRGEESSEEDPPIDITSVQDMLSSHHYKSFKISMIHKLRFTTDVQLGNVYSVYCMCQGNFLHKFTVFLEQWVFDFRQNKLNKASNSNSQILTEKIKCTTNFVSNVAVARQQLNLVNQSLVDFF